MTEEIVVEMDAPTGMLMLPAPTNCERLSPGAVPITDPDVFKYWADWACTEWPAEMQADAYRAYEAAKFSRRLLDLEGFRDTYLRWYLLSEEEKDRQIDPCDREQRKVNRKRAMTAFETKQPIKARAWLIYK